MYRRIISTLVILLIVSVIMPFATKYSTYADPELSITVKSNNLTYYLRENNMIYGNLTSNGSPVSDGLVAIEVRDSIGSWVVFRTLRTGNITDNGLMQIVEVVPCDEYMNPVSGFRIEPYPEISWAYFKVTVRNNDTMYHPITLCLYVYDGNAITLGMDVGTISEVPPGETRWWLFSAVIPNWAYIGEAKAVANAYTNLPKNGGVPYCLEKSATFQVVRGPLELQTQSYKLATVEALGVEGTFNMTFKLSPEPRLGTYTVYATGRKTESILRKAVATTTFEVKPASFPPQASFTYTPSQPYVNQTVTFDATGSSAEGYNDTILSYEWNFGDGTPLVKEITPITTHAFQNSGTYIVTLNVTDSEGLWCTTSKPVKIIPPTGPTADFIWYPSTPTVNQTVTFDASSSLPGWNGTHYTPIVEYEWDFGDGNTTTVGTSTINHVYTAEGNYTVTLTVTDTQGLQHNKTETVRVSMVPPLLGDINGDGVVNILDAILLAKAFGSRPGSPNWDPRADLNKDNVVNILDAIILALNFGKRET